MDGDPWRDGGWIETERERLTEPMSSSNANHIFYTRPCTLNPFGRDWGNWGDFCFRENVVPSRSQRDRCGGSREGER